MGIKHSEFTDWKLQDITRAFFHAAQERVEDTKEILATSAGLDHANDNFYRGFIAAYIEMQDFRVDDTEEDTDGN